MNVQGEVGVGVKGKKEKTRVKNKSKTEEKKKKMYRYKNYPFNAKSTNKRAIDMELIQTPLKVRE